MAAARKRRAPEEEHENHERWMVSYADMVTLLMVMFIVLYAISQVDVAKFNALKDGMAAGFGNTSSPFQGASAGMKEPGSDAVAPISPSLDGADDATTERISRSLAEEERRARYAAASAEVARLQQLQKRIEAVLKRRGLAGDVQMKIDSRGLTISLVSRHIVFENDVADLTRRGRSVLDVIAPVLRDIPEYVDVDGHTNQVPVKPKYYDTDWDLSAARAVTVLRYLDERKGIPARRLSARAFGHEKPLIDPKHKLSQMLNKRVDVVVISGADEATRALFDDVLRDMSRA